MKPAICRNASFASDMEWRTALSIIGANSCVHLHCPWCLQRQQNRWCREEEGKARTVVVLPALSRWLLLGPPLLAMILFATGPLRRRGSDQPARLAELFRNATGRLPTQIRATLGLTVLAGGSMLLFGGCLDSWWGNLLLTGAVSQGFEFVLDNDAVFDLFQDDFGTGASYDDRFTAAPTRTEPDDDSQAAADAAAGR